MLVENKELQINTVDTALNNLEEFSEWRYEIAEFTCSLNNEQTQNICTIFDNAFNLNNSLQS